MKYESGTGWPSFFTTIPGVFDTKKDFFLIYPRTEYHCKRCGGHHGHLFDDGPPPTNQRWCNNGAALKFIPKDGSKRFDPLTRGSRAEGERGVVVGAWTGRANGDMHPRRP